MAFHVGQKVVCINNSCRPPSNGERIPEMGPVYTIRDLFMRDGLLSLRLVEIVNPKAQYIGFFGEGYFTANRFRPAVECKTDISIFTAMLTSNKATEPA